ncbi:MAG: hypothetical protein RIR12_1563 [Bacteroidota bacterium]|jgi:CheY-like chemotaxis protein
MIYIFDDKKNRQEVYKWTKERFEFHKAFVTAIHEYSEVQNLDVRKKLFIAGNVILFHESFFDADFNRHHKEAVVIRRELEEFANNNPNFFLTFFSGSKGSRFLNNNVAYVPVSILYQNLEEFILKSKTGNIDLKYLLFGRNPNIEIELVEKLRSANASLLNLSLPFTIPNGASILIATTIDHDRLPQIVTGAGYNMNLSSDNDVNIDELINTILKANQYDKIFIPLCFGTSLSDFNGLKLAVHIRCTNTINRCKPIYIYSFVKIDELINHEYFNILKQKNIQIIDYSVKAFEDVIKSDFEPLELAELPEEMSKLKLDVPNSYEDSHSIANEWAVYRWSKAIDAANNAIQKIIEKVNTQLYFKYLTTIYPTSKMPTISEEELQIKKQGEPKILYVDDEAEKGWYEILCRILGDINKIENLDYLGDQIKLVSQQEIINKTISKVIKDDIDLVILDFRLHPNDFVTEDMMNVTGLKILEGLKKINPGIQVIIFTASNKVWNLLELQDTGADGFVLKESPDLTPNSSYTCDSIVSFCRQMEFCFSNTYLKEVWKVLEEIRKLFSANPLTRYYPNDLRTLRGIQYQNLLLLELDSMYNILNSENENRLSYAMLIQFKIVECIVEIFIHEKARDGSWLFFDRTKVAYFYTEDNKIHARSESLAFFDKATCQRVNMKIPAYEYNSTRNKIDCLVEQKLNVENKPQVHSELKRLVNYRNRFIHPTDRLNLNRLNSGDIVEWITIIGKILKSV